MTTTTSSTTGTTTTTYDSASIGSALLTALGGGSGINMTSMATAIAQAQYMTQTISVEPAVRRRAQDLAGLHAEKRPALAVLLAGHAGGRHRPLPQPTVTNSSVASATLPSGSSGASSSYTLEVTQLATSQVLATSSQSTSATMKGGTLTFNFGTISNGTFTAGSASSTSITISDGASLSDVATAINSAGMGVTAYIASSTNGQQLVIKGSEGAANAFTITGSDSSGATSTNTSLSAFAYDPLQQRRGADPELGRCGLQAGRHQPHQQQQHHQLCRPRPFAEADRHQQRRTTTITYSDPSSSIKTTMSNLVAALNTLVSEVNTDTSASGSLYGDTAARA
jgi:flagellar hook-associated protein 2